MNSPDFQNLPTRLGVYTLTRHIGNRGEAALYLATQSHVERGVVVEVLPPASDHEAVQAFLASARARVAVSLPYVTQVFESMVSDDIWYLTQERPEGRNIARIARDKGSLTATQVCVIVEAAAALYQDAAARNVAAGGLAEHDIYMRKDDCVSFLSPVQTGEHSPELVPVQQQSLALALLPHLPKPGTPGQSRVTTLVDWMLNGYEGAPLEWSALADTAALVREQLAPQIKKEQVSGLSGVTRGAVVRQSKRNRRKLVRSLIIGGIGVAVAVVAAIAGVCLAPSVGDTLPANDGSTITCRRGKEVVHVDVRPVSIREYREFLLVFEDAQKLNRDQRRRLVDGVPSDGSTRRPADWDAQWEAATQGKEYKGKTLSLDSPVVGVSYWDALVYARYREAELPSAGLLYAATAEGGAERSTYEWTTDLSPQTDIYRAGAILLAPDADAPPLPEPDRSTRNTMYGFRLVHP